MAGRIKVGETKNWSGLDLPSHLSYEEAVTHCVKTINRECGLVGAALPDETVIRQLLENWGLNTAVLLLLEMIDSSGKKKDCIELGKMKKTLLDTKPDISQLPGGWEPNEVPVLSGKVDSLVHWDYVGDNQDCLVIDRALAPTDCNALIRFMGESPNFEQVSVQGRKDIPDDRIGSIRTTVWSPEIAQQLWNKIGDYIPQRLMTPLSSTDWWQGDRERVCWLPVGMSPLLRFMRYESGGQHFAHYDAGFIYPNDNYRTLQSVVIYLTTAERTGATRFIQDDQSDIPIWDRNHLDWARPSRPEEVIYRSLPKQGKVIVFDHRICHDVESYHEDGPRIIIRADIIFQRTCYE